MKRKIRIIGMLVFLLITSCITVYAEGNSVILEINKTNLEVGEIFSVKLKAVSPDGINGIFTTYDYDTEKLELISKKVLDENFADLGRTTANEITLMFNPSDPTSFEPTTETHLYEITLKIKENAKGKTKITVGETELSTLAQTDSEHKLPVEEITIKINNEKGIINLKTIAIIVVILVIVIFVAKSKNKKKSKK